MQVFFWMSVNMSSLWQCCNVEILPGFTQEKKSASLFLSALSRYLWWYCALESHISHLPLEGHDLFESLPWHKTKGKTNHIPGYKGFKALWNSCQNHVHKNHTSRDIKERIRGTEIWGPLISAFAHKCVPQAIENLVNIFLVIIKVEKKNKQHKALNEVSGFPLPMRKLKIKVDIFLHWQKSMMTHGWTHDQGFHLLLT